MLIIVKQNLSEEFYYFKNIYYTNIYKDQYVISKFFRRIEIIKFLFSVSGINSPSLKWRIINIGTIILNDVNFDATLIQFIFELDNE